MSLDMLPFLGISAEAVGALLLALVHLKRPANESVAKGAISLGAFFIFSGFLVQAWDFLGKKYGDYCIAALQIIISAVAFSFLYLLLRSLVGRPRTISAGGTAAEPVLPDPTATPEQSKEANYDGDNFRQWLTSEISRNQAYHNHKETVAWTATAFYITGIITLGFLTPKISACWTAILVILLCILIVVFLWFQFENRWIAARQIERLIRTILKLQSGWIPPHADQAVKENKIYPQFIETIIPHSYRLGYDRWQVELTTYFAVVLSTIIAVLSLLSK